jgi:hypothetical protein
MFRSVQGKDSRHLTFDFRSHRCERSRPKYLEQKQIAYPLC